MELLKRNIHLLSSLRNMVETSNEHYTHNVINEKEITENTISIVMTSHERSKQVYFTLKTINDCNFKDIQVIIVDDSINDSIHIDKLKEYNIHIEFISINRHIKYWANPCINYNIGFKYIKGNKVIIQNGEVCYIGDVLEYIRYILDDKYYVFDVKASSNFDTNDIIYSSYLNTDIYDKNIWSQWYQHFTERNVNYHFLTALTKKTFDKIGGFSYDYSFGSCYDDDDFLLKIQVNNITIVNVNHTMNYIGGIHLYHGYTVNITNTDAYSKPQNIDLFHKKRNYIMRTGKYLELSSYNSNIYEMYDILNTS